MCFAVGVLLKKNENIIQLSDFNFEINDVDFNFVFIWPTISFCKL